MKSILLGVAVLAAGCSRLRVTDVPPGALSIETTPEAQVRINDQDRGATPFYDETLVPGEYDVLLISSDGTWRELVRVYSGTQTLMKWELTPNPDYAGGEVVTLSPGPTQLAVISTPDRAQLSLDGQPRGRTPKVIDIEPERYEMTLGYPGYRERRLNIEIKPDHRLTLKIKLARRGEFSNNTPGSVDPTTSPTPGSVEPSPSPTAVPSSSPPSGPVVMVLPTGTTFGLRVREGPGLSYEIMANVQPGERLPLLDEEPDWMEVRLSDSRTGWVSSRYVRKEP